MIPLRIKAEAGAADTPPFVVRVRSGRTADDAVDSDDVFLELTDGRALQYGGSAYGPLWLFDVPASDLDGDVLLIVPSRGIAHRLIRANSRHNSLLVTERCDQLCVMCSQPPKTHHVDMFPLFERAIRLAPQRATIGITGGEPTLFKEDLFHLLEASSVARPDLRFHVLSNAQHFTEDDAPRLTKLARKVLWGIPLYAADGPLHDTIVAKDGAYERLRHSLATLARSGAEIELRTVVMQTNADALPALARQIVNQVPFISVWAIMQLENIGYGRKNWNQLFLDNSRDFSSIAAAVDVATAHGLNVLLYNFPLCTVPAAYRSHAVASISDWKRRYLAECDSCGSRDSCGGFFEWYPADRGFAELGLR